MNPTRCTRRLVETVFIMLIAPSMVAAQSIEWIRQIGTPEYESAYAISADTLGNVFMSGFTRGGLGAASAYGSDPFFAKYDSSGNLIWTRQLNAGLGESAWGISADGLGNVYVQGDTSDSLFGPSAGSFDVWLAKYDGNGNELWGRQFGTPQHDEYGTVAAQPLGGGYISGRTTGNFGGTFSGGSGDHFLARYGVDGDLLWRQQLGITGGSPYSRLSVEDSGSVFIAGTTGGSLFGPHAGGSDGYLAKYSGDGFLLWGTQFGTSANDRAHGGVATDSLGNVFVLGATQGDLGGPNAGDYDVFLTKFTATGTQLWTRQFGTGLLDAGDYVYGGGLVADGHGNVYLAASIETTQQAGVGIVGGDILVAKYDTHGNLVWGQEIGTTESEDRVRIATDGQGNVYFSGATAGSLGGPNAGMSDVFVGKIRDATVPEPTALVLMSLVVGPLTTIRRSRPNRKANQIGAIDVRQR